MAKSDLDKGVEFWEECWQTNDIGWHNSETNDKFVEHKSLLFQEGQEHKFFIPLCGKAVDMKWLLDQGQTVVGLDAVMKSLDDFCTEHSLKTTDEDVPQMGKDCKVKKTSDEKLKLYFGDILKFNTSIEGQFDCIWDRGALVALNRKDVRQYADLMKGLLKPGGKMLLEAFDYDISIFDDVPDLPPPFPVLEAELKSLYEPECTIEFIDKKGINIGKDVLLTYYLISKK